MDDGRNRRALLLALGASAPDFAAAAQDYGVAEILTVDRSLAGKATQVRWELRERSKPVMLIVTITDLEEERRVLLLPRVQTQGSFSFDFQFTHGGRHWVTALAEVEGE